MPWTMTPSGPVWVTEINHNERIRLRQMMEAMDNMRPATWHEELLEQYLPPNLRTNEREEFTLMYELKDTKLILSKFFGEDEKYKIDFEFDIKASNDMLPQIKEYMESLVEIIKRDYRSGSLLAKQLEQGFWSVCRTQKANTLELGYTEDMLRGMIVQFNKTLAAYEMDLEDRSKKFAQAILKMVKDDGASYLVQMNEKKLKIKFLKEVIVQLYAVLNDEADYMLFSENHQVVGTLSSAYNSLLCDPANNRSQVKPIKYQYKTLALNYPLADELSVADHYKRIMDDYYNQHTYNYVDNCIKIFKRKIEKKAAINKDINLKVLYPNLKMDLRTLRNSVRQFEPHMRKGISFSWEYLSIIWTKFNSVKVKLMFAGYSEKEAVEFINTICFGNRPIAKCDITQQLIPSVFAVPLKPLQSTIINVNAYFLYVYNNNPQQSPTRRDRVIQRYKPSINGEHWYEVSTLEAQDIYLTVMQTHKKSPLEFLSPRSVSEHTKPYTKDKGYRPTPYLGVELEVERHDGCPNGIFEETVKLLGQDFAIFKYDGSLRGNNPFEIVTIPATLAYHKERWKAFMDAKDIKTHLTSFGNGHCGMHVHISRDSFTGLHLAKFMRFINWGANAPFIAKVAQRSGSHFSRFRPNETIAQAAEQIRFNMPGVNAHYEAVNTSNADTIEVRIFRGNLAKTSFFKNLEFVHAVWDYTLTASMTELTHKDFLFWLFNPKNNHHKRYANLEKWLVAADYTVPDAMPKLPVVHRDLPQDEKLKLITIRKELKTKYADRQKDVDAANRYIKRKFLTQKGKQEYIETPEQLLQTA